MVSTAVLLVQDPAPNSITQFHDSITNQLPKILGRWSFELKIFKNNSQISKESSFLCNITFDHEPLENIMIVNNNAIISSSEIPEHLVESGSSSGSHDPLDAIVQSKLQSLWLHRQTLKGDHGNTYELQGGKFRVRTANVSLHGSFKSFLIEIKYTGKGDGTQLIQDLIKQLEFPPGTLSNGRLKDEPDFLGDLAYQYITALR